MPRNEADCSRPKRSLRVMSISTRGLTPVFPLGLQATPRALYRRRSCFAAVRFAPRSRSRKSASSAALQSTCSRTVLSVAAPPGFSTAVFTSLKSAKA